MGSKSRIWGLPLFAKELVEQANRSRTYIVRVIYAALLFLIGFVLIHQVRGNNSRDEFGLLGHGREIFDALIVLEFIGIYLFLPALMSSAITHEKERNSLMLLLLTRLTPRQIVLEKYFSRLVPMFSLILLSLPLLGFTYALGGLSTSYLWSGFWTIGITALQVGALALACSAYYRTTVGSFISSYLFLLVMLFAIPMTNDIIFNNDLFDFGPGAFLHEYLETLGVVTNDSEDMSFMFLGLYILFEHGRDDNFSLVVLRSTPILASTVFFLVLARFFVVRRAFVPNREIVLSLFRGIDRMFQKANDKWFAGKTLTKGQTTLPEKEPIAWRETKKKSLGTVRYLTRIFIVLEFPVVLASAYTLIADASNYNWHEEMNGLVFMYFLVWIIAVLMVSVKAVSLVSGERSNETLDVLLTTPISTVSLLHQKMRAVWRLIYVLAMPLVTMVLLKAFWVSGASGDAEEYLVVYLLCALLCIGVYLPLAAWLSFLIAMWMRTQSRAIMAALGTLVAWCILPFLGIFALAMLADGSRNSGEAFSWMAISSPMWLLVVNEFFGWDNVSPGNDGFEYGYPPIFLNFLLYGGALMLIRQICITHANEWLGRLERPIDLEFATTRSFEIPEHLKRNRTIQESEPSETVSTDDATTEGKA